MYLPLSSQFFRPFDDTKTHGCLKDSFRWINFTILIEQGSFNVWSYIAFFSLYSSYYLHIYSWKIPNSVIVPSPLQKKEKRILIFS